MWRKCMIPGSMLTYIWRQDSKVFPASWILIGQFKFQALQPNACKDRVATIVSVRSFERQCRSSCNWRKSKMLLLASFHVFSGHHTTEHTKWRFYTRLWKFLWNISTNISWSLGKCTGVKLGEAFYFLSSITWQFLSFFHWIVLNLFFIAW